MLDLRDTPPNSVKQLREYTKNHLTHFDTSKCSINELKEVVKDVSLLVLIRWKVETLVYDLDCPVRIGNSITIDMSPILNSAACHIILLYTNSFKDREYDMIEPSSDAMKHNVSLLRQYRSHHCILVPKREHQSYQLMSQLLSVKMDGEDIRCYYKTINTYQSPLENMAPTNWMVRQMIHPYTETSPITVTITRSDGDQEDIVLFPGTSLYISFRIISVEIKSLNLMKPATRLVLPAYATSLRSICSRDQTGCECSIF